MATVKHIKIKNQNYNSTIQYLTYQHNEFTNKPILDENGNMIVRDDFLIEGINCSPASFGRECAETNRAFGKNTNFDEIKAHHYIVSFDPRDKEDNGLTMEKAQAIGMELAKAAFPGHQVIVCTHPDGHNSAGNIHCHIVLNSVRKLTVEERDFMERSSDHLAGCKHHVTDKFMKYFKQSVMDICQRENLYQIDLISPARVKITDREYWAQLKGQKALNEENSAKIEAGAKPEKITFETKKGYLRRIITTVMTDCSSLEEFNQKLLEQYGIEVNESREKISYLLPDQNKPIRGDKLGTDFEKQFIVSYFKNRFIGSRINTAPDSIIIGNSPAFKAIVDISTNTKAQQNPYYARQLKINNLKQEAKAKIFLEENGITSISQLDKMVSVSKTKLQETRSELKSVESQLKTVNAQIHYTGQYLANRSVYKQYLQVKNKKSFRSSHESELLLYETARKELKQLSVDSKLPSLKDLKAQKLNLTEMKNALYEEYTHSRALHKELSTIMNNVSKSSNNLFQYSLIDKEQIDH